MQLYITNWKIEMDMKNSQVLENFAKEYGTQIKFFGIESVIDKNIIPDSLLYPNRLLLLNFNYTHTADLYIPQGKTKEYWFPINHIHGDLEKPDDIIFGYGDELDDRYGELVKLYNNEHLRNIKSTKYLEADNYRKMLTFINSTPYQVYIMSRNFTDMKLMRDRVVNKTYCERLLD